MGKNKKNKGKVPFEPKNGLPLIDCHCHFPLRNPRGLKKSYDKQYKDFFNDNGKYIITSAEWDLVNFTQKFMKNHKNMYMTAGWGPQTVTYTQKEKHDKKFTRYLKFLKDNTEKYVCIGEIGLDFHHAKKLSERERQIDIFEQIMNETIELGKPYSLHLRNPGPRDKDPDNPKDRYNDSDVVNDIMLDILEDFKVQPSRVMFHCFSGPSGWGKILADEGYIISVPSSAYGFNRWRRNIIDVPIKQLLAETDSSWQHPFKYGGFNTPQNVKFAIAAIAYSHDLSQEKVAEQILLNAKRFFKID